MFNAMKFIGQGNYMGILNFKGVCVDGVQYLWCPEEEKKHTPVNSSSDISGTSALSKSSLNIWKFTVHVLLKSGLENFERFFASICSVQFSCSVMSDSLRPHEPQHTRPPCPSTNSRSLPKLMYIESVMPSTISSSVVPFSSCPQSFPASGSFPMSQLFAPGGQNIGVSPLGSVPPMNTQD